MKISPQAQQFVAKTVDKNKDGVAYQELKQLDQDSDGKLDAPHREHINAQDTAEIEATLQELKEGKYNPSEIAFPTPIAKAPSQIQLLRPPPNVEQVLRDIPWPPAPGTEIPGFMLNQKWDSRINTPQEAIYLATKQVSSTLSVSTTGVEYNKDLKDGGKLDTQTGVIQLGNDAFQSPAYLRATLVHELVHRRHFLTGKLFEQPLGKSELEAYDFTLSHHKTLGLSNTEVEYLKVLRQQVANDWKSGKDPDYQKIPIRPLNYETLVKEWQKQ
jgi:hypothetical protein